MQQSAAYASTSQAVERMLCEARKELGPDLALIAGDTPEPGSRPGTITVPLPVEAGQRLALRYRAVDDAAPGAYQRGAVRLLARLVGHELHACRMSDAARSRRIARVRGALAVNGLAMEYQPVFDLQAGSVVGVEALARFPGSHRQDPALWFRDAAEVGLGLELELTAVARAVEGLSGLPHGAYLAINVSPATALAPELAGALGSVPLERLVLEITEHAPVDDYDALNRALRHYRAAGARLAVDDTGAGFASLRHIWRMEPDIIKVDVSLIRNIGEDLVARALSYSLRALGSAMNAAVVAEGIESQQIVDILRFLGVDYGQGFHLQRPGPVAVSSTQDGPDAGWGRCRG